MCNSKSYRAERKALQYLYGDANEDALFLDLALHAKKNEEKYSKDLDAFKKLFNSGDKELQLAAWNALSLMYDFAKEDFTDEEAAFLSKRRDAQANFDLYKNPNHSISTVRLILRPSDKVEELQLYHDHLQNDGDFSLYTGLKLSKDNLSKFNTLFRPYCFAIYEKKSGKMIGIVGLHSYKEKQRMSGMDWYIFKPYRKSGYAKEAVTALTKQAFSGKLAEMRETSWENIFRRHYAKIDLIRVHIREANTPSQALAKACGFVYQYTDKRYFEIEGKGCEDAMVYELTPGESIV